LLSWIAIVFNNANWFLARLVLSIVQLFAQIPGGHFYVDDPHWSQNDIAKITVLDVGPGAAVHLRPRGADWLFDCGSERNYQRVVRPYLHWAGVNRLDGLLLTHGDSLHIGGAAELLRDFPRVRLIDNPAPDRSTIHQQLQRLLQQRGIKTAHLAAGDSFRLSREVTAHVLFPPRVLLANVSDDQAYVIQLVVAPSTSILFMSDSGEKTENSLLAYGLNLRSDIIIKGQHQSGQSGSDRFLDAVRPQLIIATSRDFPEHERISDKWAENVRTRSIKLFRLDETGAVTVRVSRHGWEAESYLIGETFRSSSR
jgi:beta-lactamase superfamily II metal-dependent hydrolase